MRILKKHISYAGFTLVELSAVLVIIGLLVGGVLVGKTLYYATQLTAAGRDVDMLKSDIALFKEKYNCLPGDCANATDFFPSCADESVGGWTFPCNGNGNGRYESVGEGATKFYQHLSLAGISFYGPYTGNVGTGLQPGVNIPRLSWLESNSFLYPQGGGTYAASAVGMAMIDGYWCYPGSNNGCEMWQPGMPASYDGLQKILVAPIRQANGAFWFDDGGLLRAFTVDLDNKFDDGRPNTGTIRSLSAQFIGRCTDNTGTLYNSTNNPTDSCMVGFVVQ